MDNRSDRWRLLQDHETPPPTEAFDQLRHRLFPTSENRDDDNKGSLERLREHSVTPPPFLHSMIKDAIKKPSTVHPLTRRRWGITAAAACVLLIVTGIFVYKQKQHSSTPPATANTKGHAAPAAVVPAAATDSTVAATTAGPQPPSTTSAEPDATAVRGHLAIPHLNPSLNGHPLILLDNDLLFTFTNYRYPEIPAWIDPEEVHDLKIHVDQYTNILLSPAMSGFIRDLYSFRKNGKPARKARKAKERLEKWQAADQKLFDSGSHANPLDPLDLSEFLFR